MLDEYRREVHKIDQFQSIKVSKRPECTALWCMDDLVNFLYEKDHLNDEYGCRISNCKHFSVAVYNRLKSEGRDCRVAGVAVGLLPFVDLF